ncbi:hypothetical protein D3C71_1697200 [compost metagenome]
MCRLIVCPSRFRFGHLAELVVHHSLKHTAFFISDVQQAHVELRTCLWVEYTALRNVEHLFMELLGQHGLTGARAAIQILVQRVVRQRFKQLPETSTRQPYFVTRLAHHD